MLSLLPGTVRTARAALVIIMASPSSQRPFQQLFLAYAVDSLCRHYERSPERTLAWSISLPRSNTPIRTRPIEEVAAEAHRRAPRIFSHWSTLHAILWNTRIPCERDGSRKV